MRRRDIHSGNPRKFGDRAEANVAAGGYKKTPGSGSSSVKGDLRRGDFMVEVKATKHQTYSLNREVMAKLKNDGLTNGLRGVLVVCLGTGEQFAIMPLSTFEQLVPDDAD